MSDILFEREHSAIGSFPYIELINENLNFIAHYHDEIELVYVERGSIKALSSSREILLDTDDICFFMPGEIHSYQTLTPNNVYVFKLSPHSYVEHIDFDRMRLESNRLSPSDAEYATFKLLIDELRDEYLSAQTGYEFAVRACKNRIILALLRLLPYEAVDHKREVRILNSINQYLNDHYTKKITLEEMAEACHFSKYYFAHKIKELSGMTFVAFVTAFRLEKAKELLSSEENMRVTDIAHRCGFGDLRSFNRAFRATYQTTPSEFKKSIAKER